MGSQLRFDPSFFGLALRAAAEADASLFSAHGDLSGIGRPARAGLRLTSPAKASGERGGGNPGTRRPQRRSRGKDHRVARQEAPPSRVPRPAASPRDSRIASPMSSIRGGGGGNGAAPGNGFLGKERIPDVRDACGEGRKGAKKARRPFTPLPDDVFSDDVRDGRGIYRQRGEVADAQAPGNGFF